MASYPHTLVITREAAGGKQNPAGGGWASGGDTPVYDDEADVQEAGSRWLQDDEGTSVVDADAVAFLKDETKAGSVKGGDGAVVTWEDATTREGTVVGARRLDGVVFLEWL